MDTVNVNNSMYSSSIIKERWDLYTCPEPNSGCWIWLGPLKKGTLYGKASGKHAHRRFYAAFKGAIPNDLTIDHKCKNKLCCNPDHLQAVTIQKNLETRPKKWVSHCPKGHEFVDKNTRWSYRGDGRLKRQCAECERDRDRQRYLKYKENPELFNKMYQKRW